MYFSILKNKLIAFKLSSFFIFNPLTVIVAYLLYWQNRFFLKISSTIFIKSFRKNLDIHLKKFFNQILIKNIFLLGVKIKKLNFSSPF